MTDRPLPPAIESPCNKTCTIDPETRLCIGCLRSLDEIAAWSRMTPEERRAVMALLPERTRLVETTGPEAPPRTAN